MINQRRSVTLIRAVNLPVTKSDFTVAPSSQSRTANVSPQDTTLDGRRVETQETAQKTDNMNVPIAEQPANENAGTYAPLKLKIESLAQQAFGGSAYCVLHTM